MAELLRKFEAELPQPVHLDAGDVLSLMQHFDLCLKVDDKDDVYQFPAHLPQQKLCDVWKKASRMTEYIGRRVQCSNDSVIFSPGLFNHFQARACLEIDKQARMWRDGIVLTNTDQLDCPVQCLVTMVKPLGAVDFVVRGGQGSQEACLSHLRVVLSVWFKVVKERSPGTGCDFCYLSKDHLVDCHEHPAAYTEDEVAAKRDCGPGSLVRVACDDYDVTDSLRDLVAYDRDPVIDKMIADAKGAYRSCMQH